MTNSCQRHPLCRPSDFPSFSLHDIIYLTSFFISRMTSPLYPTYTNRGRGDSVNSKILMMTSAVFPGSPTPHPQRQTYGLCLTYFDFWDRHGQLFTTEHIGRDGRACLYRSLQEICLRGPWQDWTSSSYLTPGLRTVAVMIMRTFCSRPCLRI